ncbi:hypothetical protein AMATHDRAFT_48364 [Amanita thiersii Skay4041]|uniref:Mid2 domain-containing protein n=1 Tax=Amanita thiersii Skay4041 TaxID=703135 RepID=A0A2A9NGZ5_9AGAR|nr:hypothetical protein AMATHDRAFT_48364 [Amanita thiersii Skay4041]
MKTIQTIMTVLAGLGLFFGSSVVQVDGAPATRIRHLRLARSGYYARNTEDMPAFTNEIGEYYNDLSYWKQGEAGNEDAEKMKSPTTTGTSALPETTFEVALRPTGPGIELDPNVDTPPGPGTWSGSAKESPHPYAPGLHKLLVVGAVVLFIGLVMLCCFLYNERQLLFCCCSRTRKSEADEQAGKKYVVEKRRPSWMKMRPSSDRALYSPPSPSDRSTPSPQLSPATPQQDEEVDLGSDYPRSKWSMTISDYGVTPRTSAATSRRLSDIECTPIVILPSSVYTCSTSDVRHVRNQSAPVTPSIASSEYIEGGRMRSSSTSNSSGKHGRVVLC